jgi:hypothetical protein
VDAVVFHHDLLGADDPKSFVSVRITPGGTPLNGNAAYHFRFLYLCQPSQLIASRAMALGTEWPPGNSR